MSHHMTKPKKWHVRPAKTQISPVWSQASLCTQWVAKDPSFLHADSENSESSLGAHAILLVLSCGSSNIGTSEITASINLKFDLYIFFFYTHLYVWKMLWRNGKQYIDWSNWSLMSSLIWVCAVCSDLSVQKLRCFTLQYNYWCLLLEQNKHMYTVNPWIPTCTNP